MRTPSTSAKPLSCGATARAVSMASATTMSGRRAGRERVDGLRGQTLAADAPVAALDLVDDDPGHAAHVLTFDLDHGVGDLLDHRALLIVVEDAFNDLHV